MEKPTKPEFEPFIIPGTDLLQIVPFNRDNDCAFGNKTITYRGVHLEIHETSNFFFVIEAHHKIKAGHAEPDSAGAFQEFTWYRALSRHPEVIQVLEAVSEGYPPLDEEISKVIESRKSKRAQGQLLRDIEAMSVLQGSSMMNGLSDEEKQARKEERRKQALKGFGALAVGGAMESEEESIKRQVYASQYLDAFIEISREQAVEVDPKQWCA